MVVQNGVTMTSYDIHWLWGPWLPTSIYHTVTHGVTRSPVHVRLSTLSFHDFFLDLVFLHDDILLAKLPMANQRFLLLNSELKSDDVPYLSRPILSIYTHGLLAMCWLCRSLGVVNCRTSVAANRYIDSWFHLRHVSFYNGLVITVEISYQCTATYSMSFSCPMDAFGVRSFFSVEPSESKESPTLVQSVMILKKYNDELDNFECVLSLGFRNCSQAPMR